VNQSNVDNSFYLTLLAKLLKLTAFPTMHGIYARIYNIEVSLVEDWDLSWTSLLRWGNSPRSTMGI